MKALFSYICILLAGVVLAAVIAEYFLHPGITHTELARKASESTIELDPELGWRNREGHHTTFESRKPLTILSGGFRDTGSGPYNPALGHILVLGCSSIFGWELPDEETFCWKLQKQLPDVQVLNAGVPAYGTCQCLLVTERYLASNPPPLLVVYGFAREHIMRNVGDAIWVWAIDVSSRYDHINFPYCLLDSQGQLTRLTYGHNPWPLSTRSGLMSCMSWAYAKANLPWVPFEGPRGATEVTEKLVATMNETCKSHGTKFILLQTDDYPIDSMVKNTGVDVISCSSYWRPDLWVSENNHHPGGEMHSRWVECAGQKIAEAVQSVRQEQKKP